MQPVEPAQLVVAQGRGERGGLDHLGPAALGVCEPFPQPLQRAGRRHLDGPPVDLGRPGEDGRERVHRRDLAVLLGPGAAHLGRIDEDPSVAQPHEGPPGLGEPVELGTGQLVFPHGETPVESEEGIGGEEGGQGGGTRAGPGTGIGVGLGADVGTGSAGIRVRSGVGRVRADHRPGRQPVGEFARPVDLDAKGREGVGRRTQELRDLLVGQLDRVGNGRRQERGERGPGAGGAPEGEKGVHTGAGPERRPDRPGSRPHLGRVRDQGRIRDAVQLEHRAEAGRLLRLGGEAGQFEAEREADARVVHGGHVGRPRPLLGERPRLLGGEGGSAGRQRGRRGARQGVRDGVGEGPEQRLGFGQQGWSAGGGEGEGDGVGRGRHRRGERTELLQLPGAERSGPPRVVVAGRETGQEQTACHEVEGEQPGGAPEGGGGGRALREPGADEQRQGVPYGEGAGGDGHGPEGVVVHNREFGDGRRGSGGARQRLAVRRPEGDPSGAGRIGGEEDRGVVEELPGGFTGGIIGSVRQRQRIPQI